MNMADDIDDLITSINDAGQTTAKLLIGLVLVAATMLGLVFATTDEAVLRDAAIPS
jgi:hypothetical protein